MNSFTQFRIARPTGQLEKIIDFYKTGLGLPEIGSFEDHAGYTGIMFGLPDGKYHLEFTQHINAATLPLPSKDHLLVFYYPNEEERNKIAQQLFTMGYPEVEPENPYWKINGITIEDPDGWRIVLVNDFFNS
jgi:catechol 2,3-dioxygenase-like lactoylglutathione lyase family enzyme